VRGGHPAGRDAPSSVLKEKGGFRLSSRKAELAGVARNAPGGMVLTQRAQALCDIGFIEPFDFCRGRTDDNFEPFGTDKLDRARAVLPDDADKAESVPRRDLEFLRPLIEHQLVVGKQSPEERIGLGMAVLCKSQGHGDRKRIGVLGRAPLFVIYKGQPCPLVTDDASCFSPVQNGDQFRGHFRFSRAEAMIESISTGGGPGRCFVFP